MKIDGEKLARLIEQAAADFNPAHPLDSREIELGRVHGLDVVVVIGNVHVEEKQSALEILEYIETHHIEARVEHMHAQDKMVAIGIPWTEWRDTPTEWSRGYYDALKQIQDTRTLCRTVTPEPATAYDNGQWAARMDVCNSDGTGTAPADLVAAALKEMK